MQGVPVILEGVPVEREEEEVDAVLGEKPLQDARQREKGEVAAFLRFVARIEEREDHEVEIGTRLSLARDGGGALAKEDERHDPAAMVPGSPGEIEDGPEQL